MRSTYLSSPCSPCSSWNFSSINFISLLTFLFLWSGGLLAAQPKKIVLFTLGNENGHSSAVNSQKAQILTKYPDTEVIIKNINDFSVLTKDQIEKQEKDYLDLLTNNPQKYTEQFERNKELNRSLDPFVSLSSSDLDAQKLAEYLQAEKIDVAIGAHWIIPLALKKAQEIQSSSPTPELKRPWKIGWIYTDFYHQHYFPKIVNGIDHTFVGSKTLKQKWINLGADPQKITASGIPTPPTLTAPLDKAAFFKEKNLDASLPTITLAGGGEGLGNLPKITESLYEALKAEFQKQPPRKKVQLVVVTGKNTPHYEKLEEWKRTIDPQIMDLHLLKSVPHDDYLKYVKTSDLYIVKSGGLSPTEGIALKVPMILLDVLGGHEKENALFYEAAKVAKVNRDPATIGAAALELLNNPIERQIMKDAQNLFLNELEKEKALEALIEKEPSKVPPQDKNNPNPPARTYKKNIFTTYNPAIGLYVASPTLGQPIPYIIKNKKHQGTMVLKIDQENLFDILEKFYGIEINVQSNGNLGFPKKVWEENFLKVLNCQASPVLHPGPYGATKKNQHCEIYDKDGNPIASDKIKDFLGTEEDWPVPEYSLMKGFLIQNQVVKSFEDLFAYYSDDQHSAEDETHSALQDLACVAENCRSNTCAIQESAYNLYFQSYAMFKIDGHFLQTKSKSDKEKAQLSEATCQLQSYFELCGDKNDDLKKIKDLRKHYKMKRCLKEKFQEGERVDIENQRNNRNPLYNRHQRKNYFELGLSKTFQNGLKKEEENQFDQLLKYLKTLFKIELEDLDQDSKIKLAEKKEILQQVLKGVDVPALKEKEVNAYMKILEEQNNPSLALDFYKEKSKERRKRRKEAFDQINEWEEQIVNHLETLVHSVSATDVELTKFYIRQLEKVKAFKEEKTKFFDHKRRIRTKHLNFFEEKNNLLKNHIQEDQIYE